MPVASVTTMPSAADSMTDRNWRLYSSERDFTFVYAADVEGSNHQHQDHADIMHGDDACSMEVFCDFKFLIATPYLLTRTCNCRFYSLTLSEEIECFSNISFTPEKCYY